MGVEDGMVLVRRTGPVLRPGDKGDAVRWLQSRLQDLGYDVGPIDGDYGFLTEDAVQSLQRQYGLKVDGIAGPRVRALLQDPDVAGNRLVHVVGEKESLPSIAEKYGVSTAAIRLSNPALRRTKLAPGTRLVIRRQLVLGGFYGELPRRFPPGNSQQEYEQITGFLPYSYRLIESGSIAGQLSGELRSVAVRAGIELIPVISNFNVDLYDEWNLQALLRCRDQMQKVLDLVKSLLSAADIQGVTLDLQGVALGYRRRFASLVHQVRMLASRYQKRFYLVLVPAASDSPLPRYIDRRLWSSVPDRVVLQVASDYVTKEPGPRAGLSWLRRVLDKMQRYVPCWKIILALPGGGIDWQEGGEAYTYTHLAYDEVRTLAYRLQAKVRWDETEKTPYYEYTKNGFAHKVWFDNRDSFRAKLSLVSQYSLAGIAIIPWGWEDIRIWKEVADQLAVKKNIPK